MFTSLTVIGVELEQTRYSGVYRFQRTEVKPANVHLGESEVENTDEWDEECGITVEENNNRLDMCVPYKNGSKKAE